MTAFINSPYIVVKLMGGLGNQMFQYAAGRALAVKHHVPLLLDVSFLETDPGHLYTKRNYELDQLNIIAKIAAKEELNKFTAKNIFSRLMGRNAVYHENSPGYDEAFESLGDNVYLDGFWQSEKYFSAVRRILETEFTPSYTFNEKENDLVKKIRYCNSIGIHVRRGDYVNLKSAAEYHGVCGMDYYNAAIVQINNMVKDPSYFIFSDDLPWCHENFKHLPDITFVNANSRHSGFDLYLMSCCNHNIIANSSYSWWGAWLNQNQNKIVIAPKNWFAPKVLQNKDLLPDNYIKL